MIDTFVDTLFDDITETEESSSPTRKQQSSAQPTEASLEEQALSAAELAHTLYSLHGTPQPLALIKILGSLDSNFLSDRKQKDPERFIAETILGIFL